MIRDDREPWRIAWQNYKDDVRSVVRIEDVVAKDAGPGKPTARNGRIRFSSPFRSEKTPSFDVHPEQGSWYDYGDATGGDVFSYLMRKRGCSFREAIDSLAADYNVIFRPPDSSPEEIKAYLDKIHEKKLVRDLQFVIVSWMHEQLTAPMRAWMFEKYGLTDDTLNELKIGFGGPTCYEELSEFRTDKELLSTGFFHRTSEGKIFGELDNRMVFPYWVDGHVVYAAGRYYEPSDPRSNCCDQPRPGGTSCTGPKHRKYLKLLVHKPDNPYVSEAVSNEWFFNEDVLKGKPAYVVITEGYTDCALLKQSGVPSLSPVTKQFRESDYARLAKLLGGDKDSLGVKKGPLVYVINDTDAVQQKTNDGSTKTVHPGKDGSLAIARKLLFLGVNVQIGTIPEMPGISKVDLNDYLRVLRPEDRKMAMGPLFDSALCLPDILLRDIPADTKPQNVTASLKDWADVVSITTDSISRSIFIKNASKKFNLRYAEVEKLIKPLVQTVERTKKEDVRKRDKDERQKASESRKGFRFRGAIKEDTSDLDVSYFIEMEMGNEYISNFTLTPKKKITDERGQLTIICDVNIRGGKTHADVPFPQSAWIGKKSFLSSFPILDMNWTGSDDNVQGLLSHLTAAPLQHVFGTTSIGYHEIGPKPEDRRYILPHVTLNKDGPMVEPDAHYLKHMRSSLSARMTTKLPVTGESLKKALSEILEDVYLINEVDVLAPALAWFWACPFRPRIQAILGHFPILNIWGTQGSGKSATGALLWRLSGAGDHLGKYNCTDTKFALAHIMSSSNTVPVFFDEFKQDMGHREMEIFTRLLRRAYDADTEERGNQDKSTSKYPLTAPILVAGESKFEHDPALAERMVSVNPTRTELTASRRRRFESLRRNDHIEEVAMAYAQWTLTANLPSLLKSAKEFLQEALQDKIVEGRVFDNLLVLVVGSFAIQEWTDSIGVKAPDMNLPSLLKSLQGSLSTDQVPGDSFDEVFEDLATMAAKGILYHETHYLMMQHGRIRFAIKLCMAEHEIWCKQQGRTGNKIGKSALLHMIYEKTKNPNSYITDVSYKNHQLRADMISSKPHCFEVDPSRVPPHFMIDMNVFHHSKKKPIETNRNKPEDKPS